MYCTCWRLCPIWSRSLPKIHFFLIRTSLTLPNWCMIIDSYKWNFRVRIASDTEFVLRHSSIFRTFILPCMWFLSFSSQFSSAFSLCTQMKTGLKMKGTTYREERMIWICYYGGAQIICLNCMSARRLPLSSIHPPVSWFVCLRHVWPPLDRRRRRCQSPAASADCGAWSPSSKSNGAAFLCNLGPTSQFSSTTRCSNCAAQSSSSLSRRTMSKWKPVVCRIPISDILLTLLGKDENGYSIIHQWIITSHCLGLCDNMRFAIEHIRLFYICCLERNSKPLYQRRDP